MSAIASFSAVRVSAVAPKVSSGRKAMAGKAVSARVVSRKQNVRMTKVYAKDLSEDITKSIEDAKDACEDGTPGECAAAWDTVEELSAEAAHQKAKAPKVDPMEEFCAEDPSADECRVYED